MTHLGLELAPGYSRIIITAKVQLSLISLVIDAFTLQLWHDDTALHVIRGLGVLVGSSYLYVHGLQFLIGTCLDFASRHALLNEALEAGIRACSVG